jgi:hypothetical protein
VAVFRKRKDEEDPFAALRSTGTYQSAPTTAADIGLGETALPAPADSGTNALAAAMSPQTAPKPSAAQATVAPPSASPTQATPTSPRVTNFSGSSVTSIGSGRSIGFGGGGFPIFARLVAAVIVIAAVAIPIAAVTHSTHSIKIPSFNFTTPTTSGGGGASNGSPQQTSYLTAGGLRAGLAHVARVAPGARISLLRIDDHSLNVTATLGNGTVKQIYFGPTGSFVTSGASTGQQTLRISQVKLSALARIEAGMRHKFHVPPSRIDYMVLSAPGGLPAQWIIFANTPAHPGFAASLSGGNLHRLG